MSLKVAKVQKGSIWDKLVYVAAFAGPIGVVPQVVKIFLERNASGVSVLTWTGGMIGGFFWLAYGIKHKDKPIVLANALGVGLSALVIIGTLIYG